MRTHLSSVVGLAVVLAVAALAQQDTTTTTPTTPAVTADAAAQPNTFVGTQVCSGCHKDRYDSWLLTPHRRTLAEGRDAATVGCESCHGPGGAHVAGGGDPTKIVKLSTVGVNQITEICLKCHKQPDVLLFRTGAHSMSKVGCNNCHDVHSPGATMLRNVEAEQLSMHGLTQQISEARQEANLASKPDKKAKALDKVAKLEAKKTELQSKIDSPETRNRRASESELCFSCHKEQRAQFNLTTHHPVRENRMQCSSCHNPHGGPSGNMKDETVSQTCFKCHQEFSGPYVFEHPPVEEDCSLCHRPHGSAQNYLLKQSEPFLCLKCHPGPHSRSSTFANTGTSKIGQYYWQCTSCHNRPHGSDRHASFHY